MGIRYPSALRNGLGQDDGSEEPSEARWREVEPVHGQRTWWLETEGEVDDTIFAED